MKITTITTTTTITRTTIPTVVQPAMITTTADITAVPGITGPMAEPEAGPDIILRPEDITVAVMPMALTAAHLPAAADVDGAAVANLGGHPLLP